MPMGNFRISVISKDAYCMTLVFLNRDLHRPGLQPRRCSHVTPLVPKTMPGLVPGDQSSQIGIAWSSFQISSIWCHRQFLVPCSLQDMRVLRLFESHPKALRPRGSTWTPKVRKELPTQKEPQQPSLFYILAGSEHHLVVSGNCGVLLVGLRVS